MTDLYNYDELLVRLREALPEIGSAHSRFKIGVPDIVIEGKMTIIRNFVSVAESVDRDPQHLAKYLFKELGVPGTIQSQRLVFKGRLQPSNIEKRLNDYIKTYVICYECGSPDTSIQKEGRVEIIVCKACGAMRPVHMRKDVKNVKETIEEGSEYEVTIIDLTRDGDGIARVGDYMVYIPGAKKGEKVRIKVERIKMNIAFAKRLK